MSRFAAVLMCAAGMAFTGRAEAQSTAPIELTWNALESCPSAETVLARVHKIAGATRATPNTLKADATVTQPSSGLFRLRLEIQFGKFAAVRNIEGKSCKDLAGAAAVALALLLSSEEPLNERDLAGTSSTSTGATGSTAGTGQLGDNPTTTPNQPATTQTSVSTPTVASPPSVEGPPRRWNVLLVAPLAALSFGPLPKTSGGLGLAAGFSFDRWRFFAEGKSWASQRETVGHLGNDYALEFNRYTVGARACRSMIGDRLELGPCVLMSVHHLSVRGSGRNLVSASDATTWAAVGIGAQARLRVTPWLALVASVDGELQLSRPELGMTLPTQASLDTAATVVQRLAPAAATLAIGSQWIF